MIKLLFRIDYRYHCINSICLKKNIPIRGKLPKSNFTNQTTVNYKSNRYSYKVAGFYSLTPEGKEYITFMDDSTKETIINLLKDIRKK